MIPGLIIGLLAVSTISLVMYPFDRAEKGLHLSQITFAAAIGLGIVYILGAVR